MSHQPIRGVIFDFDGTLVTSTLDFDAIRAEIGLPYKTPILEAMERLPAHERARAQAILDRHEMKAAARAQLLPGATELFSWLHQHEIRRGILSRNSRWVVTQVLHRLGLQAEPILAREDAAFKPDPEGIWKTCRIWGLSAEEVIMVGDYVFDLEAGRAAGVRTALVTHGKEWPFTHLADLVVPDCIELHNCLAELILPPPGPGRS